MSAKGSRGDTGKKESKADQKYADGVLQGSTTTPIMDMLQWPVALVVSILGLALRLVGVRAAAALLVPGLILLPLAVTRPFKVVYAEQVRQRIIVAAVLCQWTALVAMWPWGFSWPGPFGLHFAGRILLWPTSALCLMVWATLIVGWRSHLSKVSDEMVTTLDGRHKVTDLRAALKSGTLNALRPTLLPGLIEAGVLPEHTSMTSVGTLKRGASWAFKLPRGHRGLDVHVVEQKVASFLETSIESIRVRHQEHDHSRLVIDYFTKAWPTKVRLPPIQPGVLRLGWYDTENLFSVAIKGGSDALHLLVTGMTGSGKSNTVKQEISEWLYQRLFEPVILWLGDPTGGTELGPFFGWAANKAITAPGCVALLQEAHAELELRYTKMGAGTESDDWDHFQGIYDGPWLVVVIDEMPQVLDEDNAAVMAAMKAIVQRGRRAKVALTSAQQTARAKAMGGDAKTQFPTRICHQVAEPAETNLALKQGLVGQGIDASKLKTKGRGYVVTQHDNSIPEIQFYEAPEPKELAKIIPRTPDPSVVPGGVPRTVPGGVPDEGCQVAPSWSEGPVDVRGDEDGTPGTEEGAWAPEGWDLPPFEPEHEQAGARLCPTCVCVDTDDDPCMCSRVRDLNTREREIFDALAGGPLTVTDVACSLGVKKGGSTGRVLQRLADLGLVRRGDDGRWERLG